MSVATPSSPVPRWFASKEFLAALAVVLLLSAAAGMAYWTKPVRGATRAYAQLMAAVNAGDLDGVRKVCTARYLAAHPPELAAEGGVVGFPRNIHKNFKAWSQGEAVWLCPTNSRLGGPLYQFVEEPGGWRFDGPIGLLHGGGRITPMGELEGPDGRPAAARD